MEMTHKYSPEQDRSNAARDHRRQVFWQISAPLAVAVLILGFLGYLASASTFSNFESGTKYSSISLIWILLPWLLIAFVTIIISAALIFGISRLLSIIPAYALKAQIFIEFLVGKVVYYNDKAAEPVIHIHTWLVSLRVVRKRMNIIHFLKSK